VEPATVALDVEVFVDVERGARSYIAIDGPMRLYAPVTRSLSDLGRDVGELVREEELEAVDGAPAQVWGALREALCEHGIRLDDHALRGLRFVVVFDDDVRAMFA